MKEDINCQNTTNDSTHTFETDVGVLDVGSGAEPDPRADTALEINDDPPAVDIGHDLSVRPWPIADASADGIIMNHVIEHLDNPDAVMQEISRIVKPGGWVEISVPIGGLYLKTGMHKTEFSYHTFKNYDCEIYSDGAKNNVNWDKTQLTIESREIISFWITMPLLSKFSPIAHWVARRWPGAWVSSPLFSGTLQIRFSKVQTE